MNKFSTIVKTISLLAGLLSCLFFSSIAVYLLSQGYQLGDCVTVPIVGIEIPFCRPTPTVAQATQTVIAQQTDVVNPTQQVLVPTSVPVIPSPVNNSITCTHPDQLAAQMGWKDSRLIDKFYGGYNVYISNSSQLPPLWEANYFGMDNVLSTQIRKQDTNRQMDIGTWIIYPPDECRPQWGFATSLTPAPSSPSLSDIPSTVLCIHPEELIRQKGWENLGVFDILDGGFKARLSSADILPDYWEANRLDENNNLLRQILFFDQDKRMDIGIWIIYVPPVKSCRDQFGFKIGGK